MVDSDVGEYVCVVSSNETRVQSEPAIVELTDALHRRLPPSHGTVFEAPKRYFIDRGPPSDRRVDVGLGLESLSQSGMTRKTVLWSNELS